MFKLRTYAFRRNRFCFSRNSSLSPQPSSKVKMHHVIARFAVNPVQTILESSSISNAISYLVGKQLHTGVVVNKDDSVVGIFTARDLLRHLDKANTTDTIGGIMTKLERLVHCSANDSAHLVREIMFQLKISNIAVVENNMLLGMKLQ